MQSIDDIMNDRKHKKQFIFESLSSLMSRQSFIAKHDVRDFKDIILETLDMDEMAIGAHIQRVTGTRRVEEKSQSTHAATQTQNAGAPSLHSLSFDISSTDQECLIKPVVDQFVKQMTPSASQDQKKAPIPNTFLKTYTVVQHLVKNKIKASENK